MIKNKFIKPFNHKPLIISMLFLLSFFLHTFSDLIMLYSRTYESINRCADVSIRFQFDERLKSRPFQIFLKKKDEWSKRPGKIAPNRVQYYEVGKVIYDFHGIKPGTYWVGFSFKYLLKKKINNLSIVEYEYVKPAFSSDKGYETDNRIEIKKDKKIFVELKIQLRLIKRAEPYGKEDPQGYSRYIPGTKPRSPEEKMMLDENYFVVGAAGFMGAKISYSKSVERSSILFVFDVFDDYPLAHLNEH